MLGDVLLCQPLRMLSLFDTAIQSVAQLLLDADDSDKQDMVRIVELSACRLACKEMIRLLKSLRITALALKGSLKELMLVLILERGDVYAVNCYCYCKLW